MDLARGVHLGLQLNGQPAEAHKQIEAPLAVGIRDGIWDTGKRDRIAIVA